MGYPMSHLEKCESGAALDYPYSDRAFIQCSNLAPAEDPDVQRLNWFLCVSLPG